jgi:dihydroorotase
MPTTLSKLLVLGMSLEEVLVRATARPAQVIGRISGMGTLDSGAPADIALLGLEEGEFRLVDSQRNVVTAPKRLVSRLTICRGRRLVTPA